MSKTEKCLRNFIRMELDEGEDFATILESFDIDAADVFVMLYAQGLLNPEQLEAMILDFE